jgi:hypothetical protein
LAQKGPPKSGKGLMPHPVDQHLHYIMENQYQKLNKNLDNLTVSELYFDIDLIKILNI